MLGDVTFGQYYNARSFLHKTDPRTKILLLIAYIVAVFLAQNFLSLVAVLVFLIVAIIFSSVPLGSVLEKRKGDILSYIVYVRSERSVSRPARGRNGLFLGDNQGRLDFRVVPFGEAYPSRNGQFAFNAHHHAREPYGRDRKFA